MPEQNKQNRFYTPPNIDPNGAPMYNLMGGDPSAKSNREEDFVYFDSPNYADRFNYKSPFNWPQQTTRRPPEPQVVNTLGGGLKQYGQRWINDMNYNLGRAQRWINDEGDIQQGLSAIMPQLSEYSQLPVDSLDARTDRLNYNTAIDTSPGALPVEQQRMQLGQSVKAIDMIRRWKKAGRSPEEIKQLVRNYLKTGGAGTQRMQEALGNRARYNTETQGWGTVGDMAGGALQQAIPIAASIAFPPLRGVLAAANLTSLTGQTHAQSQMDVDQYEKETGKGVSDAARYGYVGANTALDLILEKTMQGRYLGQSARPTRTIINKDMVENIFVDPSSAYERSALMQNYKKAATAGAVKGLGKDALAEGATEATSALGAGLTAGIYDERKQTPDWQQLIQDGATAGITGAALGGALGGMSRGGDYLHRKHQQNVSDLATVANYRNQPVEVVGQDPKYAAYAVRYPEGGYGYVGMPQLTDIETTRPSVWRSDHPEWWDESFDPATLSTDDFSRYMRERMGNTPPTPSMKPRVDPNWKATRAEKRNMIEDMAKGYGVEFDFYNTPADLRKSGLKAADTDYLMGFYDPKSNRLGAVLDNIGSEELLRNTVRHESVGHKGMQNTLGKEMSVFYDKAFKSLPPDVQNSYLMRHNGDPYTAAAEYIAEVAGLGNNTDLGPWDKIQGGFRETLRNSIGSDLPLNQADFKYALWKSQNSLKDDDTMGNMVKKSNNIQKILEYLNPKGGSAPKK